MHHYHQNVWAGAQVRIVYFDIADTIRDPEVKTRLGMEDRYNSGTWQVDGPPRVKLTGALFRQFVPLKLGRMV